MVKALPDGSAAVPIHLGTDASAAGRRSLRATAARIFDILAASREPLGAYDILERLRSEGRYDPPTVYRALAWLVRNRMAHRLETLKAYVALRSYEIRVNGPVSPSPGEARAKQMALASDAPLGTGPTQGPSVLFIICDSCRSVSEVDDPGLGRLIGRCATAAMFTPRTGTVEILGMCVDCREQGSDETKRDTHRRSVADTRRLRHRRVRAAVR